MIDNRQIYLDMYLKAFNSETMLMNELTELATRRRLEGGLSGADGVKEMVLQKRLEVAQKLKTEAYQLYMNA